MPSVSVLRQLVPVWRLQRKQASRRSLCLLPREPDRRCSAFQSWVGRSDRKARQRQLPVPASLHPSSPISLGLELSLSPSHSLRLCLALRPATPAVHLAILLAIRIALCVLLIARGPGSRLQACLSELGGISTAKTAVKRKLRLYKRSPACNSDEVLVGGRPRDLFKRCLQELMPSCRQQLLNYGS